VHKHEELRLALLTEIRALPEHSPLPTERDIAADHQVSRNTVRLALDTLETSGDVYRIQGAGTFVASRVVSKSATLTSFSEDMLARGLRPGSRLLAADTVTAGDRLARHLGLIVDEPVVRISRLRLADEAPMCLENVHLPAALVPGLTERDLSGSLYRLLHEEYGLEVHRAEQSVTAVALDQTRALLLGTPQNAAALEVERVGLDQRDRPIEMTTTTYRADRYEVRFTVRRKR